MMRDELKTLTDEQLQRHLTGLRVSYTITRKKAHSARDHAEHLERGANNTLNQIRVSECEKSRRETLYYAQAHDG